jgi:hypothetical protein
VIPNNSFENWTEISLFDNPAGYHFTSNVSSFLLSMKPNVTKTSDKHGGNFAARLETIKAGNDTLPGMLVMGNIGSGGLSGGIPYDERPDSLRLFAKHNLITGDTAVFMLVFKKEGQMIGAAVNLFGGNKTDYTEYMLPVLWMDTVKPDTIFTIIASAPLDNMKGIPGSVLYIDDITLYGAATPFPNEGFELWNPYSSEEPNYWSTSNLYNLGTGQLSVTKTIDKYEGDFAVKIQNVPTIFNMTLSFVTNGTLGDKGPRGGSPLPLIFDAKPDKITGYYKFTKQGNDTAIAGALLSRWDKQSKRKITIDSSIVKLLPAENFTPFEIPFLSEDVSLADTLFLLFAPGDITNNYPDMTLGSTLFIDDISLIYKETGANEMSVKAEKVTLFPNPSDGKFKIRLENIKASEINLKINNVFGMEVYEGSYNNGLISLNLSFLPKGIYFVNMEFDGRVKSGKLIIK